MVRMTGIFNSIVRMTGIFNIFFFEKKIEEFFLIPFYLKILTQTLNRLCLCYDSSVFQVDRGVTEGLSAELTRESTW
jgi:hypothetical protein